MESLGPFKGIYRVISRFRDLGLGFRARVWV